ncbi:MAG: hypothetical protein NW224_14870 [Leptolyngbyaceae cyanobacterium bins.302]|nr:hypothetical protein [Leptolyngbyaceae cyanobacterium bins.302]
MSNKQKHFLDLTETADLDTDQFNNEINQDEQPEPTPHAEMIRLKQNTPTKPRVEDKDLEASEEV